MTDDIEELEQAKRDRRSITVTLVAVLLFGLLAGFNTWYTNRAIHRSNQLWCSMMVGLDDNYRAAPPGSLAPRTVVFARQVQVIRHELGCADTPQPHIVTPSPSGSTK